ncbi:MAG: hypothetical protein RLZZ584_1274 [Pseudomonadota bacterium]|jgi:hypothetical protein
MPGARTHLRAGQADASPPVDTPWCYFDLAEICLYQGDRAGFLRHVDLGCQAAGSLDELTTFGNSLALLKGANIALDGLDDGLDRVRQALDARARQACAAAAA